MLTLAVFCGFFSNVLEAECHKCSQKHFRQISSRLRRFSNVKIDNVFEVRPLHRDCERVGRMEDKSNLKNCLLVGVRVSSSGNYTRHYVG